MPYRQPRKKSCGQRTWRDKGIIKPTLMVERGALYEEGRYPDEVMTLMHQQRLDSKK